MTDMIHALYCDPPIAIARLGGSTAPLVAYAWAPHANPRNDDDTGIVPDWSLEVLPDGSLAPFLPQEVRFRDGPAIRPVCPFVEVWARMGEAGSDASTWRDAPLTEALLADSGLDLSALSFKVEARNAKAARRTGNVGLAYGLFPAVTVRGDHHDPVPLTAVSMPGSPVAMIPPGRGIPFGTVQICKPGRNPPAGTAPWPPEVDLEVVRLRFTPPAGLVYGPPEAAVPTPESPVPAVPAANAFLNGAAGWYRSDGAGGGFVNPSDTFDAFAFGRDVLSLGVVDDTCDARIEISLKVARPEAAVAPATANVLVGPPDFAPDRRPFLSIADDLNDRSAAGLARSAAMSGDEVEL